MATIHVYVKSFIQTYMMATIKLFWTLIVTLGLGYWSAKYVIYGGVVNFIFAMLNVISILFMVYVEHKEEIYYSEWNDKIN